MTLGMAAGQQKKRLISSTLTEQYRGKKKKRLNLAEYLLNFKSRAALEWDDCQKRAVAKREQIAITWKDVASFLDAVPEVGSGPADVLSVPVEIFGLENLTEVLSYEVWATCLSEAERKLLAQFLPSGTATEQVVQSLLTGENLHFGNPLINWSGKLCSGSLHPDEALYSERKIRANKKVYYKDLNRYHTNMLEALKKWKEIWTSSHDPEKLRKAFTKNYGTIPVPSETTKTISSLKKDLPLKPCVRNGDVAKYMSYITISRKQLEMIKSMKQPGDGIQTKSLKRVLGDIKSFLVQPYEVFEEEEKKRLHEHWLQMVSKDLPVIYDDWRSRKLQKERLCRSLEQEFVAKMALSHSKIMESNDMDQVDDGGSSSHQSASQASGHGEDDSSASSEGDERHVEHMASLNNHLEMDQRLSDQEGDRYSSEKTSKTECIASLNSHLQKSPSVTEQQTVQYSSEKAKIECMTSLNCHLEMGPNIPDRDAHFSLRRTDLECIPAFSGHSEKRSCVLDGQVSKFSPENMDLKYDLKYMISVSSHQEMGSRVSDQEAGKYSSDKTASFGRKDSEDHDHDADSGGTEMTIDNSYRRTNSSQATNGLTNLNILQTGNGFLRRDDDEDNVMQLPSLASVREMWQHEARLQDLYYHASPERRAYNYGELSVRQTENVRQLPDHSHRGMPVVDLQTEMFERHVEHPISSSMPVNDGTPMFCSYSNQDQNNLLQTFTEGRDVLTSYSLGHFSGMKQPGPQFLMADSGKFSHQFEERQRFLEQRQLSGQQYLQQGSFESVARQTVSAMGPSIRSGVLNNNWFSGDFDARNSWLHSSQQLSNNGGQSLGNGGAAADGSLLSVLSSCKMMPPNQQSEVARPGQFGHSRNLGGADISTCENRSSHPHNQLIGSSSVNAAATSPSINVNSLSWLNLQHQKMDVHDFSGSQFSRPWDQ